jgi:acyl-CoA thioesterase II
VQLREAEGLPEWDFVRPDREEVERIRRWRETRPVYIRTVHKEGSVVVDGAPQRQTWIKPKGVLPEDPAVHAAVLTFASDMGLISTARPFLGVPDPRASASLDHAVWFHHPPRFDDWLLYTSRSPIAHGARALIVAQMYRRDGTQIVSVAQEGLIRSPREKPAG